MPPFGLGLYWPSLADAMDISFTRQPCASVAYIHMYSPTSHKRKKKTLGIFTCDSLLWTWIAREVSGKLILVSLGQVDSKDSSHVLFH